MLLLPRAVVLLPSCGGTSGTAASEPSAGLGVLVASPPLEISRLAPGVVGLLLLRCVGEGKDTLSTFTGEATLSSPPGEAVSPRIIAFLAAAQQQHPLSVLAALLLKTGGTKLVLLLAPASNTGPLYSAAVTQLRCYRCCEWLRQCTKHAVAFSRNRVRKGRCRRRCL